MAKRMDKWSTPEAEMRLRGMKMDGLRDDQVAEYIGISERTLSRWKSKSPIIRRALRVGKDVANYAIENALFKKAMHGNTACIIFWLKNNFSRKYSDTQDSYAESKLKHAQLRKIKAEAKLVEQKAKNMDSNNQHVSTQVDKLLGKIFDDKK